MAKTTFNELKNAKKGLTHGTRFHADDVFSAALLEYINPEIEIIRSNKVPKDFDGIVFDIGDGEFDHHKKDKYREDGSLYAAFGLLWEVIGPELVGEEDAERFDRNFIEPMDQQDNFGGSNQLCRAISKFNPRWEEDSSPEYFNLRFNEAKKFALEILKNEIRDMLSIQEAEAEVLSEYEESENKEITILSKGIPWKPFLVETEAKIVILPSPRGGYNIQPVPAPWYEKFKDFEVEFPEEWLGVNNEKELFKLTGIEGFTFCHGSGFLACAKTLNSSIEIAKKVLEANA